MSVTIPFCDVDLNPTLSLQGTDKSYLVKQHELLEDHPYYIKGSDRRNWEKEFGILHYAGTVVYQVQGFLDKNKDTQQDQLFELMHNATNNFVKDLTRFQVCKWLSSS